MTLTILCWVNDPDNKQVAGSVLCPSPTVIEGATKDGQKRPDPPTVNGDEIVELTVVMPCLNEAETGATCVAKAMGFLAASGISGEVLVADNGSTDGSQRLATEAGGRRGAPRREGARTH